MQWAFNHAFVDVNGEEGDAENAKSISENAEWHRSQNQYEPLPAMRQE
jgi:hypothetical protein